MSGKRQAGKMLRVAEKYLNHGWRPIPIVPRAKRPLTSWEEFQNRPPTRDEVVTWFTENPDANIGIITGTGSGIIAIDVDGEEGEQSLKELGAQIATLTSLTAHGRHLIFAHPGVRVPTRVKVLPGVDVRGDGGLIVAPPSVHETGFKYRWENPRVQTVQPVPIELRQLVVQPPGASQSPKLLVDGNGAIPEGQRSDTLVRIAGHLLGKGNPWQEVLAQCLRINDARCAPPLPSDEVEAMVTRISRKDGARRSPPRSVSTPAPTPAARLVSVCLADVQPQPVKWLWNGYIPLGKLTVIDGDPGLGKSSLTLDLAARVSTGQAMPDRSQGISGSVVILTCEDGIADTVVPRLQAMKADVRRVRAITDTDDGTGGTRLPSVPDDVALLRTEVEKYGAVLVIVDPLMGYLSPHVNSWSDQHMRRALAPLAALAEDLGIAIVVIRHLSKNEKRKAIYRGGGSIAVAGAARATFVVAKHPEDEDRRVLASVKSNLGPRPASMSFCLEDAGGGVRIVWQGRCDYNADELLEHPKEWGTKLAEAKDLLNDYLADGPKPVKDVEREARSRNISSRTLDRARSEQGVLPGKVGGVRVLQLPQSAENTELAALMSEQRHRQPVEGSDTSSSPPPSDTPGRDATANLPEPGSPESWDLTFDDEDAAA